MQGQLFSLSARYNSGSPWNIPNGQKIYQHFPIWGPPKFTQIGIFGLKTKHLATQIWRTGNDPDPETEAPRSGSRRRGGTVRSPATETLSILFVELFWRARSEAKWMKNIRPFSRRKKNGAGTKCPKPNCFIKVKWMKLECPNRRWPQPVADVTV
jgi:hypothetical protein